MTARPRGTTTLVGPNRIVLAAATGGLVALASAGTALLVLTGTSAVAPLAAPAPPLPSFAPPAHAPGVVVVPSAAAQPGSGPAQPRRTTVSPVRRQPAPITQLLPVAVPFTAPAVDVPVPVAAPAPVVPEPAATRVLPTLRRVGAAWPGDDDDRAAATHKAAHAKHVTKANHAKQAKHGKHGKHAKRHHASHH